MISFNMAEFNLFKITKNEDKYGTPTTSKEFIGRIPISVSFITENKRINEIEYKNCNFSGVTPFKDFENNLEYEIESIVNQDKTDKDFRIETYKIKSINTYARLTQLLLERVATYE